MPLSGEFKLADSLNPSVFTFGTPASKGDASKIPKPPRTTVRSDWNGFQAKPKRGPKFFQFVAYGALGTPATPMNVTTPSVPETGLIWEPLNPFMRLFSSISGVSVSQRTPMLRVRLGVTVQASCAKAAR